MGREGAREEEGGEGEEGVGPFIESLLLVLRNFGVVALPSSTTLFFPLRNN